MSTPPVCCRYGSNENVLDLGSTLKYNLTLCQTKDFNYMGTAQIIMPENYIAMFDAPQAEEARQIVARSELDIDRAITSMTDS